MLNVSFKIKNKDVSLSLKGPLSKSSSYMVSKTQDRIAHGQYQNNAPLTVALKGSSKPLADTGLLLSSINGRVEGDKAIISTNRIGARINNEGGKITAKKSRLWIPAQKWVRTKVLALGTTGTLKYLKQRGSVWFTKNAIMYKPKKGKAQVVWILKKSVNIPQRRFMYINDQDIKVMASYFKGLLDESNT